MHSGLRSGMEAACQRPPGGPVYRCPGKYRGGEALREIPGCGCPGGCTGGRDRGNRQKPCGLGHSKARDISACMKILRDKYQGKVPDDFDELLSLPGVGRKSANLVMGDVFGKPAIVTDTHCIRLVNRMGLVDGIKEPKKVEMVLWKLVPPEEGSDFCHRLVFHGRDVCTARTKPRCEACCLNDICKKAGVE